MTFRITKLDGGTRKGTLIGAETNGIELRTVNGLAVFVYWSEVAYVERLDVMRSSL